MGTPIIPRIIRGRLFYQTSDALFPTFALAVTARSATDAHRLDLAEAQPPLRRCEDCAHDLGRDVLRAIGNCPRWGTNRAGVESDCPAFVAKDGAR